MVMLMNPSLTKETTGSNQFGPIQMYAATYAQWRITAVRLKATPVVGASAVSGTIGRVSLNMTGNPTSASWSALGARPHADLIPGKGGILRLNHRNFPGPKEGWYNTNTKGDPNMSIGGAIEVHTLGKTMSTYKNEPFTGGLWLLELTATWEFRNYNPQPGLLNMIKGKEDNASGAQIVAEAGQPIEMEVAATSRMARAAGGQTNSEIIWQVADTTIKTITSAFPPPFNWLFQGGWWFIKRVADAPVRAGTEKFRVYASIQDARADVPCIASQAATIPLTNSEWTYQQVTPGNTGLGDQNTVALGLAPDDKSANFISAGAVKLLHMGGTDLGYERLPASSLFIQPTDPTRLKTAKTGFGFSVETAKRPIDSMLTYDIKEIQPLFFREGREIDPSFEAIQGPPVYFYPEPTSTTPTQVGVAYAFAANQLNTINTAMILFQCTNGNTYAPTNADVSLTSWGIIRTPTISNANSATKSVTPSWGGAQIQRFNYTMAKEARVVLRYGDWYILTYSSVSGKISIALGNDQVGLVSSPVDNIPQAETWQIPPSGFEDNGIVNSLGGSLTWTPFTSPRVAFNNNGWQREAETAAPQIQTMTNLDLGPREPSDPDTDYDPETDPEMLPDMTETESESSGCEDEDAPPRPPTPGVGPGEAWSNPPTLLLEKLTETGRKIAMDLETKGVPRLVARKVAQETDAHPGYKAWSDTYQAALIDGLSPPSARSVAWAKATKRLGSRGHAE